MKHKPFLGSLALLVALAAIAAAPTTVKPLRWDPNHTGAGVSARVANTGVPGQANDPDSNGLVMQKAVPTAVPLAPYAHVTGADRSPADSLALGFDYRNTQHCTSVAPRFSVGTTAGTRHLAGCASVTPLVNTPQYGWNRVRFTSLDFTPPLAVGSKVGGIYILFDEGVDTAGVGTPGTVTLDNIVVNGSVVTRSQGGRSK